MLSSMLVALSLATLGQCTTCGPMDFSPGAGAGSWSAGAGGMSGYDSVSAGGGGGNDQLYPFDSPEPWLHGYFQEMPAYGGHASFRPHNYKHVLAQSQMAGRWGINPTMAYAHQWYHRYRNRSGMHPGFGASQASTGQPGYQNMAQAAPTPGAAAYQMAQAQASSISAAQQALQQSAAIQRGYPGTQIPGIGTPYYERSELPRGGTALAAAVQYDEKFDRLQDQLEQQTFQMQLLQQQLQERQNQSAQRPAWDQPAWRQFANGGQPGNPGAVQDAPPAGVQPAMNTGAQPAPQQYWQGQRAAAPQQTYQPQPYQPSQEMPYPGPQFPGNGMPQPQFPGNGMPAPQYIQSPAMNYGPAQPGPVMQVPGGQAWIPQPGMQPQQRMPMSRPIPGMHTGWQQSAPRQSGNWNSSAPQNGYANGSPQQVFVPQPYDAAVQPMNGQPMGGQPYYYNR